MSTHAALRGCGVAKSDLVIGQPFQAKAAKLPANVPIIHGASPLSNHSVRSVVLFYATPDSGANSLRPHRSNPRRPSKDLYRSPVTNNLKLITIADSLTSLVCRPTGASLSSRERIPPSVSSIGAKLGRRRTVMGSAHSRLRASNSLEIVVNPDSFNKELLSRISILKEPYKRPFFLNNCHLETIFASYYRSVPKLTYERQFLKMPDGGVVTLDWPVDGEEEGVWNGELKQDVPVLILLPGLTGSSGDTYVKHMAVQARRAGWRVAVYNCRGCGDSPVTTPKIFCAAYTEDLREVVKHVGSLYPNSRVYAAGWSIGANILVGYVGQEGENCPLAGAVSLCNPFDLALADVHLKKGLSKIYDNSIGVAMRKIFIKNAHLFEAWGGFNLALATSASTIREVDHAVTIVSFGYKTVDDYYFHSSSSRDIKDVRTPLLCIQALDDPICPSTAIPKADIAANLNCALVVTPAGGHLGWIAGQGGVFNAPWTDPLVMDYLRLLEKSSQTKTAFAKSRGQAGDVQLVGVETLHTGGSETTIAEPIVR